MMPAASRHAKAKSPATRLRAPVMAAAALAGVAAAFVFLHSGSPAARPSSYATPERSTGPGIAIDQVTAAIRSDVAALQARRIRRARTAARRRHAAALAAARLAQQQAGKPAAQEQGDQVPQPPPPPPRP